MLALLVECSLLVIRVRTTLHLLVFRRYVCVAVACFVLVLALFSRF